MNIKNKSISICNIIIALCFPINKCSVQLPSPFFPSKKNKFVSYYFESFMISFNSYRMCLSKITTNMLFVKVVTRELLNKGFLVVMRELLNQAFLVVKLKKSLQKFNGIRHDTINCYILYMSQMIICFI